MHHVHILDSLLTQSETSLTQNEYYTNKTTLRTHLKERCVLIG